MEYYRVNFLLRDIPIEALYKCKEILKPHLFVVPSWTIRRWFKKNFDCLTQYKVK